MVSYYQCMSPEWVVKLHQWFVNNLISEETITNALNWLIERNLVICEQLRFM